MIVAQRPCCVVASWGSRWTRYHQERGEWPDRLDALAPGYLHAVPLDPFDGQPLRYKRVADGVVVSSITPDPSTTVDRFGRTHWGNDGGNRGTPYAFRLWDPAQRRQPAAEVLPMPRTDNAPP